MVADAGLPVIVGELLPVAVLPLFPDAFGSSPLKHPYSIGPVSITRMIFRILFPQFREAGSTPELLTFNFTSRKRRAANDPQRRVAWPRYGLMCRTTIKVHLAAPLS
jgi:hypothetical protein